MFLGWPQGLTYPEGGSAGRAGCFSTSCHVTGSQSYSAATCPIRGLTEKHGFRTQSQPTCSGHPANLNVCPFGPIMPILSSECALPPPCSLFLPNACTSSGHSGPAGWRPSPLSRCHVSPFQCWPQHRVPQSTGLFVAAVWAGWSGSLRGASGGSPHSGAEAPPAHTPRKGTRDVERNWPVMWGQVGGLSLHREVTRLEALHIAHRWSLVEAPGQPRRLKTASLDTSSGAPGAGSHVLPGELSITCETISVGLAHPSSSPAPAGEYFFVGGSGG